MNCQKLTLDFLSPIYPIYDPKTPKDAEIRNEFESDVENAIALQKHNVLKEIQRKSSKKLENQRKSAKILENLWKSVKMKLSRIVLGEFLGLKNIEKH